MELLMSVCMKSNSKQNCNQYINNSLKEQKITEKSF